MFAKILHANDGSDHAFHALSLALAIAKQNQSDLHMVCVEEIPYLPEFMEEVREAAVPVASRTSSMNSGRYGISSTQTMWRSDWFCFAIASASDSAWKAWSDPSFACRILANMASRLFGSTRLLAKRRYDG